MKTMRKALSVLLLACMLTAMCSVGAYADNTPVGKLDFDKESYALDVNDTAAQRVKLSVSGYKTNSDESKGKLITGADYSWSWSTGDEDVAVHEYVDDEGDYIVAKGKGSTTVTCECWYPAGDRDKADVIYTGTAKVEVSNDATNIKKSSEEPVSIKMVIGETVTQQLPAVLPMPDGADIVGPVSYRVSSGDEFIDVTEGGLVTAKAPGEAEVTASDNAGHWTVYRITVLEADPIEATGISFTTAKIQLLPDNKCSQAVIYTPENATAGKEIIWSILGNEEGLVSFDAATGEATANNKGLTGTVQIVATLANGKGSASYEVEVLKKSEEPAVVITVDPLTAQASSAPQQLVARIDGKETEAVWTVTAVNGADDTTVSATGLVTPGAKPGTLTVQASRDGVTASGTVTITEAPNNTITIVPTPVELVAGTGKSGGRQLYALDKDNKVLSASWRITAADGATDTTVDNTGFVVPGTKEGKVTIEASVEGYTAATCTVTVSAANTLKIVPETVELIAGTGKNGGRQLYAVDKDNKVIGDVKWRITAADGATDTTVDNNGFVVPGAKSGTVTVEASKNGYTAAVRTVTVKTSGTKQVVVIAYPGNGSTPGNVINAYGGIVRLEAAISNGQPNETVTWTANSSNSCMELFNINGNTAYAKVRFNGPCTFTARTDGAVGSVTVTAQYTPAIINGNNSVFDGKNALAFEVNDYVHYFDSYSGRYVIVDGYTLVEGRDYKCESGRTGNILIVMNPAYLNYINKAAYHTIEIGTNYGAASGYFRTWGTSSTINGVKTGDDSNLALWTVLGVLSAAGAAAIVITKRRKLW